MKFLLLAIALVVSAHVNANESIRQAKISRIIEAQGLLQMFQQQLDQSKAQASDFGKDLYREALSESCIADERENPQIELIFTQYMERCSTMFAAEEFVEIWSRFYGKDLSEADLDKILAYYESSAGEKDVASSQAAMIGFSQVLNAESQKRMSDIIKQMMTDLKAALEMVGCQANTDAAE
ncbi:MAG: hypothetical protein LBF51_07245 [Zoogloeaceae bacterium]|jgi:hypothetical protein|nr:hypothetical protein [Zoogloeaceae bacterium]